MGTKFIDIPSAAGPRVHTKIKSEFHVENTFSINNQSRQLISSLGYQNRKQLSTCVDVSAFCSEIKKSLSSEIKPCFLACQYYLEGIQLL